MSSEFSTSLKNKLRVLVVDDDKVNRTIMRARLKKLGVETQEVENGKEAVELFVNGSNFDLVLMDMEMPIMDGPEATWILRTMGIRTKIVGVTSNETIEGKKEFMQAGLDDYYIKPMNNDKLIALLREVDKKY